MFTLTATRCSQRLTRSARRGGGGSMTRKSSPYHELLCDLPPELQRAVCQAVARCRPQFTPRPYHCDWEEELYHEAALAAWQAYLTYNPNTGCSLHQWGARVIGQHLKRFCDRVWASAKHECDYPCDEETGEAVEFEDPSAHAPYETCLLQYAVQQALQTLPEKDRQIAEWRLFEALTEQEIARRLGVSQRAVSKRLQRFSPHCASNWAVAEPIPAKLGQITRQKVLNCGNADYCNCN